MKKVKRVLLLALIILPFFVQGEDFFKLRRNIVENSYLYVGPFYLVPRFSLKNVGYDSNVLRTETDEPLSDWTAEAGIETTVSVLLGDRFILTVKEHPYYAFFLKNDNLRSLNNTLDGSVHTYLGKINVKLGGGIADIHSRPSKEFGVPVRNRRVHQEIAVDIGHHEAWFVRISGKSISREFKNTPNLSGYDIDTQLSRDEKTVQFMLNFPVFTATRFSLNLEYADYRFKQTNDRNGTSWTAFCSIDFPEVGRIKGSFDMGYKRYLPENPLFSEYSTFYGSGDMSFRISRRVKFLASYSSDNRFSFLNADQYFRDRTWLGGFEYYLTTSVKAGMSYRTGSLDYRSLYDDSAVFDSRLDNYRFYIAFRVFKKAGIGVEYQSYRIESDSGGLNREYNFIGGYLTYDF